MKQTDGAALKPLSKLQIRQLLLLAREAYLADFPPSGLDFNAWRHQQCMIAVERGGLTECRNEDYLPLKAHFLRLAGNERQAESASVRYEMEPRTWAMHKLQEECSAAADVMPQAISYATGFIRNKRHVSLDDADEKTIWHAVYVVRRRAAQLRNAKTGRSQT